jgi:hypothetical protein
VPQRIDEIFGQILDTVVAKSDPFEQAFFVTLHLPYLQPFQDVNKRVSRLAANIPLIDHNLCPLSFMDVLEDLYINGLLGVYELNRKEEIAALHEGNFALLNSMTGKNERNSGHLRQTYPRFFSRLIFWSFGMYHNYALLSFKFRLNSHSLDSALALIQPGRISGKVQIDQGSQALEVDPLRRGVRADDQSQLSRGDPLFNLITVQTAEFPLLDEPRFCGGGINGNLFIGHTSLP